MSHRSPLVVGLALVLVFAACGSGETIGPPAGTTPPTAPTTAPPATFRPAPSAGATSSTTTIPTTSTTTTTTAPTPADVTSPQLVITAPQPGETVATRNYAFEGTTEPGCTVTAAGRYAANVDAEGHWSIVLVLNPGSNLATFTATDLAGNTTTAEVAVTYQPPSGALSTVLVAGAEGVYQIDPDGNVATLLEGATAAAVDDTRGGLLFQTHQGRNWNEEEAWSTIIWWVPAGASGPQELLVPDPGTDHELTLHDTYRTGTGFGVVYTRHEGYTPFEHPPTMHDRLRAYHVDTGAVTDLYRVRGWEWNLADVTAGGGLISATEIQTAGHGCRLFDAGGGDFARALGFPSATPACFDESRDCPASCALSADATRVAYDWIRHTDDGFTWSIAIADMATGAVARRLSIPVDGRWAPAQLDIAGNRGLLNRSWEGIYDQAALLIAVDDPGSEPTELPVAGRARFVTQPVAVPAVPWGTP